MNIDPSAGSGTFLIEYMKFITENIKYKYRKQIATSREVTDKLESEWFYPDYRENKWAREYIYGTELNFNLGTATKVNMILHGDGSTNIFVKDGLLPFSEYVKDGAPNALNKSFKDFLYEHDTNSQFDVILSNPPFSVDLDKDTENRVKKHFIFGNKKNSENLFIERYYQLLRSNGRMAIVLPESIFDTTENKYIRLFIYKYFNVKAIVSLPQSTFAPYTNTKTSILFAQKKTQNDIELWNQKWGYYSNEWSKLKTRILNILEVYKGQKLKNKLPSIKNLTCIEEIDLLSKMLINNLTIQEKQAITALNKQSVEDDISKLKEKLIKKYEDDLLMLSKYDNDTKNEFGMVNTWWVFSKLAEELSYDIFMAEADEIGYKRTKRGENKTPNDLFRININGDIIIDDGEKESILDYIRDIEWDWGK